ncbi:hypothetical protein ACLN6O_05240 [Acinetobacter sp. PVC-6A]|uniref:hypothetical protein n=1 Tax=Acinetobacter sp. PVC-6A TaxID=3393463 RepID=UPI003DA80217
MSKDNFKEFAARKEITFTFKNQPGLKEIFETWSRMVPTLFLLDICVVGVTKLNRNTLDSNNRKAKYIDLLKTYDEPHYCFSFLPALMEQVSDSRGLKPADEIKKQLIEDINSLRSFFKNASVYETDEFILNFADELMGKHIEKNRENFLKFLSMMNDSYKLHNTIASNLRIEKAREIIEEAKKSNISPQHPLVIIILACLYGNPSAKKILKFKDNPKKFQAENALADIMLIQRFTKIKLEMEYYAAKDKKGFSNVQFLTDDIGLSELFIHFKPNLVQIKDSESGSEIYYTFTINLKKLLTDIKDEEKEIIDLLSVNEEIIKGV